MPHSNGRIYIDTSTTPAQGVSIEDVRQTLSESSQDLGTLCRSNNINMLSVRKPTRYEGFDSGSEQEAYEDEFADHNFEAYSIRKGYTYGNTISDQRYNNVPVADGGDLGSLKLLSTNFAPIRDTWEYLKPELIYGKYRLLDFNGYLHYGTLPYARTCCGLPFDVAFDIAVPRDGVVNGRLEVYYGLRFALSDQQDSGANNYLSSLLGIQSLLGEENTRNTDLDIRFGFQIYGEAKGQARPNPLSALFISSYNLRDARSTGIYMPNSGVANDSIIVDNLTGADHGYIMSETVEIQPFLAKRNANDDGWIVYNFGVETPFIESIKIEERAHGGGFYTSQYSESKITLTALVKQDGTYVLYIASQSDVALYFDVSSATYEMLGARPVSIAAVGSNITVSKSAEVTIGTQTVTGHMDGPLWILQRPSSSYFSIDASAFNGWSSSVDPEYRVGTVIVKPTSTSTAITVNACLNSANGYVSYGATRGLLTLTGTVPANVQTGDTIDLVQASS